MGGSDERESTVEQVHDTGLERNDRQVVWSRPQSTLPPLQPLRPWGDNAFTAESTEADLARRLQYWPPNMDNLSTEEFERESALLQASNGHIIAEWEQATGRQYGYLQHRRNNESDDLSIARRENITGVFYYGESNPASPAITETYTVGSPPESAFTFESWSNRQLAPWLADDIDFSRRRNHRTPPDQYRGLLILMEGEYSEESMHPMLDRPYPIIRGPEIRQFMARNSLYQMPAERPVCLIQMDVNMEYWIGQFRYRRDEKLFVPYRSSSHGHWLIPMHNPLV